MLTEIVASLSAILLLAATLPCALCQSKNPPPSPDQFFQCISLKDQVPLPFSTDKFCSGTGLNNNVNIQRKCRLLGSLEKAFTMLSNMTPFCPAMLQLPIITGVDGTNLPYPLTDQRPLPDTLPLSIMDQEGPTMYWFWRNAYNFEVWAPCGVTNITRTMTKGIPQMADPSQDFLTPPGWTVQATLWLNDGLPKTGLYLPLAIVMTNADNTKLAIFIRATENVNDWNADFAYSEVSSTEFPGQTHAGFTQLNNILWSEGLKTIINRLVVRGTVTSVSVAGHSYGAGVATLLSYTIQSYLRSQQSSRVNSIQVDAYLFAPPNTGNAEYAAAYNKVVNARRFAFQYDVIAQTPCTPQMVACNNTEVPTTNPDGTSWQYTTVGGTLAIPAAQMPQQAKVWGNFKRMYPCQMARYITATHVCSYNCFLTQYAGDNNNMCLLWNQTTAGGEGIYCGVYPTAGRPYPYGKLV